jgi:hypothetical protein
MFHRTILILVIFAFLTMRALAAPQTFTGTITDTMCGKKHMSPGKSDADCTRDCMKLKGDWTYGLVVGNSLYRLTGDNKQFATFCRPERDGRGRGDRDHHRCQDNHAPKMKASSAS